ncbi:hypothetical protein CTRI78_v002290 [Colletotrichum trifolii]|uniref:Uncharacterized protein n=1 Tax=Colletotrichum trifolii TaxID=5466 RepID=A0A4R8RXU5_COLTR|nr:hypothetical protein CTRI78_v002290 [Colletotrichum trifolii]
MTNAVCSPVLGSVRSLFLLFLFHVLFTNASPTDLVHNERREVAFPNFDQGYEGRVRKGQYFNLLFPLDEGKAAEFNGGVTVASPFQDPSALKPNGWRRYIYWFPFEKNSGDAEPFFKFPSAAVRRLKLEITKEPEYGTDLDKAFADADYPVDKTKAGVYHYRHDRKFDNGKKNPTMSSYSNVLVPASGAMIFVDDFSPTARQKEWKLGTVPALDKLSDVAFFQWIDACKAQMVDPKTLKP